MERITEQKVCRICSGEMEEILDLGSIYPSAFIKEDVVLTDDMKAPLTLVRCKDCGLVQLKHTVDLDLMYRQYWYSSSLNKSMLGSLQDIVTEIENRINLKDDDVVIDIGANDFSMLQMYSKKIWGVGFEPALNVKVNWTENKNNIVMMIPDYFSYDNCKHNYLLDKDIPKAKVITAIAMFYDLPDPKKFVQDVVKFLDKDGIFVVQYTDLGSMLSANAFDNICHEHLEYYSFEVVKNLLESCGLEVIDVSHNDVNGASIRITAAFPGRYKVSYLVENEVIVERSNITHTSFETFKNNIELTKLKVGSFLAWAKSHNKRVYVMGASTKGNTLLQVCGVTGEACEFASEVNKEKFGLKTVGSNIKIISEDEALIKHPEYFLLLPWHFKNSLVNKPKIHDYLKSGGTLIVPLPRLTVITKTGEYRL